MKISTQQIDGPSLLAFVQAASSGAFSGNWIAYLGQSGTLGSYVAYLGQNQTFVGTNTFLTPILVPFTGGTGAALNFQAALNLISGSIVSASGAITVGYFPLAGNVLVSGYNQFTGALGVGAPVNLGDAVNVTFLRLVSGALQTGINNVNPAGFITLTGNEQVLGQKSFTGSPLVPAPTAPSGATNLAFISGMSGVLASAGGGGSPNSVTTTGDQVIGGFKQFTGSPFVPLPITGSGVANLAFVSGVSGVVLANATAQVTSLSGFTTAMSGVLASQGGNNISLSGITGNFVNMSFYFDAYNLFTGVNTVESFISRNVFFTGWAVGAITSGNVAVNLSGSLYQRTQLNVKVPFANVQLNSGSLFTGVGGFLNVLTGLNRIGLDLTSVPSGMTGVSVGIFGIGT